MSLASTVMGALRPTQTITWYQDDDTPLNLTDATLSGVIRNLTTGATRAIVGDLAVTNAAGGVFTWEYHVDDVAEAGHFMVQFSAAYVDGATPARTVQESWFVDRAFVVEVEA